LVKRVDENSWDGEVLGSRVPVVVDFYSDYCPPCAIMEKVMGEVEKEWGGKARFVQVDVDENPALAESYDVISLPTVAIFYHGELEEGATGVVDRDILKKKLESVLD